MRLWPFGRRKADPPPPPSGRVAGVIPAAGDSRRMGRSKALLDAGGRSFLSAAVGSLVAGGCDPVVVVVGPDQPEEERKARDAGALVLPNPDPGEGPVTSLRLALRALEGAVDGIAILPVDHPLVRPETVQALLAAFRDGDAPVVLPVHEGERGHPGLLRRTLFGEILDPGLEGGARTVVHAHLDAAERVEVDDPGVLADIDTPEAYRRWFGHAPDAASAP